MREIKFRIWLDGYWRYWGFIREEVTRHLVFASLPSSSGESLTMEEMMERSQEYTGLKDKTGKEIYEGDIFKTENNYIGVVKWDEAQFVAAILDEHGMESLFYAVGMNIEVIGNVWEHPELLEAK